MKLMRAFFAAILLASCGSTISTTNEVATSEGGFGYTLPRGLVPVIVFVDAKGVGVTIEPSVTAVDSQTGTLIGRLQPNRLNKENIEIKLNPETGFLTTITNTSTSQTLAIAEEAAKSLARLSFQNARAQALTERVVVMQDSFDPLSLADVTRINQGVQHAVRHARRAHGGPRDGHEGTIALRVTMPDGSNAFVPTADPAMAAASSVAACSIGICARTITSRMIRIELDGAAFGGKLVNIPSREVIPLPVTGALFADRKTTVTVQNGILTGTTLAQDSEALGLVKIPGQILGGLVAGFTQAFNDETALADEEQQLIAAQDSLLQAQRSSLQLQNDTIESRSNTYVDQTLTIYPFSSALNAAVAEQRTIAEAELASRVKEIEERRNSIVVNSEGGGDLLGDGASGDVAPPGGGN